MKANSYDVIVIGAGSVGVPAAFFLTDLGAKVLVLEQYPSPGQGQNKAAIGGVRATHSDPLKILLCLESLKIFSTWKERYGTDIGWKKGGYCYPVYREQDEKALKSLLPIQKTHGLNIDWVDAACIRKVVPGINNDGLRGGTYSPDDGQVSPLLFIDSAYRLAGERGCDFRFNERVKGISLKGNRVEGVETAQQTYRAPVVLNAAGGDAADVGRLTDLDIPVVPDSHEGGISAPIEDFLDPLVVDMRPGDEGKTANFYFGQHHTGQIIFCYTPSALFTGKNRESTSEFLPILARRMITLIPRLRNILIRRVWRGLYPMTPDGVPICDGVNRIKGMYLAAGMCGQGFMLGPGVGINMAHLITQGKPLIDPELFKNYGFDRNFGAAKKEALK